MPLSPEVDAAIASFPDSPTVAERIFGHVVGEEDPVRQARRRFLVARQAFESALDDYLTMLEQRIRALEVGDGN